MSDTNSFLGQKPTWCPGCGNWSINVAFRNALVKLGLEPWDIFVSFDIGCSGNMADFINCYGIHGLHGRALPTAIGAKFANCKLKVFVIGGDGGIYGEGGNHFLHACRGNYDVTLIVHDNKVYGLTTGQAAPTAHRGYQSKSTPYGTQDLPINPLILAISQGATFVAQGFAGDIMGLTDLIVKATNHVGFSLINVLQPCVTFNKVHTHQFYQQNLFKIVNHDPNNKMKALELSIKQPYATGILYQEQGLISRETENMVQNNFAEIVAQFVM